jgi:hypothetical protein
MHFDENQLSNHVFMVPPIGFGSNPETQGSNLYQSGGEPTASDRAKAMLEYDALVALLRSNGVQVVEDAPTDPSKTPDAHFPNNWISTHSDGTLVLYPQLSPMRRLERDPGIIERLTGKFEVKRQLDFTGHESKGLYLEGTGSLVLDRINRIAYASRSPRTDPWLLEEVCSILGYRACLFSSVDEAGQPIYHTNVLMSVGERIAAIGLDAIPDQVEREQVERSLRDAGHDVLQLLTSQVREFAGNMLQLRLGDANPGIAMSQRGWDSLNADQKELLKSHGKVITADVSTIERYGGGSVRCMIAEVFLQPRAPL